MIKTAKNGAVFALLISLQSQLLAIIFTISICSIRNSEELVYRCMQSNKTMRQMMLTSCFCWWTRPPLSSTQLGPRSTAGIYNVAWAFFSQLHNSFPSLICRETPLFLWFKCSLTPYQLQMNHFLSQRTPHVFYKPKKPSYLDQRQPARFAAQEEALQCLWFPTRLYRAR